MKNIITTVLIICLLSICQVSIPEEVWFISAYCQCEKCCGEYADGIFASGKPVYIGGVACNWLKFDTKVKIDGKIYTVEDRGARNYFGSVYPDDSNPIRHIDIFMKTHLKAEEFGVKYKKVLVEGIDF